jgi:hypothetical protein
VVIPHVIGAAVVNTVSITAPGYVVNNVVAHNVLQGCQGINTAEVDAIKITGFIRVSAKRISDPVTVNLCFCIKASEVDTIELRNRYTGRTRDCVCFN